MNLTPAERAAWQDKGGDKGWFMEDRPWTMIDGYILDRWVLSGHPSPVPEGHRAAVRLYVIEHAGEAPVMTLVDRVTQDWFHTSPLPEPGQPVVRQGPYRGSFLHTYPVSSGNRWFFPPAICARFEQDWDQYFADYSAAGWRDVLINPQQDDWGPSKGHPEWTAGGIDWTASSVHLDRVVRCYQAARRWNLQIVSGVFDQQAWIHQPYHELKARIPDLVDAVGDMVSLWWVWWEADEVWDSTTLEAHQRDLADPVLWNGIPIGYHNADGLKGGLNLWGELGQLYGRNVWRLHQYPAGHAAHELDRDTRLTADVALQTGTSLMCAEHSSPVNQSPTYSAAQAHDRAEVCLSAAKGGLKPVLWNGITIGYQNADGLKAADPPGDEWLGSLNG